MNRQEHRAPRAIGKNLSTEDPRLAELLGTSRLHWLARWLAVPFLLLGFVPGDLLLLLTAGFLTIRTVRDLSQGPNRRCPA